MGPISATMCTPVRESVMVLKYHTDESVRTINYYILVSWKACDDFELSCQCVHVDVKLLFLCYSVSIRSDLVYLCFQNLCWAAFLGPVYCIFCAYCRLPAFWQSPARCQGTHFNWKEERRNVILVTRPAPHHEHYECALFKCLQMCPSPKRHCETTTD